ncbi:MAG TPA: helix-turn-helix domain-containing protein [Candidatus Woesebacteria bacterium]|nr:helix-turn-helix domain-containing protein [Candidatus Woesebacteria bacterium]
MYTVGDLLQKARTEKELTLQQVEKKTRIRVKYLEAIETNNWKVFPSKVYITGVIRSYALFLDVEPAKALAYFRRDYEKKEVVKFRKHLPSLQLLPETKKILIGVLTVIFLFFIAYFGYQLHLYLSPPSVEIISPDKTVFRNTPKLTIVGKTDDEATINIFGDTYFPDDEGIFKYELPLKKGKNPVTFEVTGANGKKTTLKQEYILE